MYVFKANAFQKIRYKMQKWTQKRLSRETRRSRIFYTHSFGTHIIEQVANFLNCHKLHRREQAFDYIRFVNDRYTVVVVSMEKQGK